MGKCISLNIRLQCAITCIFFITFNDSKLDDHNGINENLYCFTGHFNFCFYALSLVLNNSHKNVTLVCFSHSQLSVILSTRLTLTEVSLVTFFFSSVLHIFTVISRVIA